MQFIYRFLPALVSSRSWYRLAITTLAIGCQQAVMLSAQAEDIVAAPPAALKTLLTSIDSAANSRKLPELSRYYSSNFTTSDGLTKTLWQQSLTQLWQSYDNLSYITTLNNWQRQGNSYTVVTTTKIAGTQNINGRASNLQSTIQARQKIVGSQVVQQDILQERTQVSSGAKPPTIELTLPDRIEPNAEYNLDAIVTEPLGEDVLLGATVEQPVSAQSYTQPANFKLELLTAGGLFKIARAPGKSGDYWLSTVFIRPTGMTTLTQRIHIRR
jgi:hypothetical protein